MKRLTAIVITLMFAAATHADERRDAAAELLSTMDWEAISRDLIANIRPRDVDAKSLAVRLQEAATREVSQIMSLDELARLNRGGV